MLNSLPAAPGHSCVLHLDTLTCLRFFRWSLFIHAGLWLPLHEAKVVRVAKSWARRNGDPWKLSSCPVPLLLSGSSAMGFIQAGAWREQNLSWWSLQLGSWLLLCSFVLGSWVSSHENWSGTSVLTSSFFLFVEVRSSRTTSLFGLFITCIKYSSMQQSLGLLLIFRR